MTISPLDLQGKLVEKSLEAYIQALETINRLSVVYRIETFTILICNAWEGLLKAKLLKDGISIYYPDEPTKTLSHEKCLQKIFPKDNNPLRCNIEMIINMRDDATHLAIDFIPREVMALFQTCVLNYHKYLRSWFDISLSDRVSVGMMTIVYDLKPEELDMTDKALCVRLGPETVNYLTQKQREIRESWERLGKSAEFSIDFNYKLMLVKNGSDNSISLVNDITGSQTGFVHIAKDASKTHPYRRKELITRVNEALEGTTIINSHDIQSVIAAYSICKREDFFYQGKVQGSPKQYSESLVIWIVNHYHNDPSFFAVARNKAKTKEQLSPIINALSYEKLVDTMESSTNVDSEPVKFDTVFKSKN